MKELFKQKILNEMSNSLNFQQMKLLETVLEQNIKNLTIDRLSEKMPNEKPISLLHSFLSAKKIEGCSEKSLKYYFSTIEALLNKVKASKNQCFVIKKKHLISATLSKDTINNSTSKLNYIIGLKINIIPHLMINK